MYYVTQIFTSTNYFYRSLSSSCKSSRDLLRMNFLRNLTESVFTCFQPRPENHNAKFENNTRNPQSRKDEKLEHKNPTHEKIELENPTPQTQTDNRKNGTVHGFTKFNHNYSREKFSVNLMRK